MAQHIPPLLHFRASTHCALCRKRLPEPDYDADNEPPEGKAWEYNVLGFCDLTPSGEHPRILTTRADFKTPSTFNKSVRTEHGSLSVDICLEPECRQCELGPLAHLIHMPCWKLINLSKKHDSVSIYEFAQSRYPMFDTGNAIECEQDTLMDFTSTTMQGLDDDLLQGFVRLPSEIRSMIAANCPANLLSSLHTVRQIPPQDIAKCRSRPSIIEYKSYTASDSLWATQTLILGQLYISSITSGKSQRILVQSADFKGIRFTIGPYGLRALSILYADGSTSKWLGNHTNGWSGIIPTSDFRKLYVLHDNLKYLRIGHKDEEGRSEVARVMWDKVLPFSCTQHHYILDTASKVSQIRHFPGWRLCKYLPLIDNSGAISGLTMYLNGHGVTGIVAHGEVQRQIGKCQGCLKHLFLQQNERIVSVWLRVPAQHVLFENEPSVLVITNFSRSCLFGPSLPQRVISGCQYAWTPLVRDSNILGIFYDALAIKRCDRITNFGISQNIPQHKFVANDPPSIPSPLHRPDIRQDMGTGIYFSNGILDQIKRLRVCRKGPRYTGMSIHHLDGSINVLGQWDCGSSLISDIYSEHSGPLLSILFRFSRGKSCFYVDGIFVNIDNEHSPEVTVLEQSKLVSLELPSQSSVAWWFSRDYDEVEFWEARYQELNISTGSYNIKELI